MMEKGYTFPVVPGLFLHRQSARRLRHSAKLDTQPER
jgi:hypothetical protein